jgi:hypothetical protein
LKYPDRQDLILRDRVRTSTHKPRRHPGETTTKPAAKARSALLLNVPAPPGAPALGAAVPPFLTDKYPPIPTEEKTGAFLHQ